MSEVEEQFDFQCRAYGLPVPEREYRFHKIAYLMKQCGLDNDSKPVEMFCYG